MAIDPQIREAILAHESEDVALVAREVTRATGKFVPPTLVMRVRGSLQQAANVNKAREAASITLSDKVGVLDDVANALLSIFQDETRPLKDRIEASKELRQYLKLSMEAAGIHDKGTDTLFVFGEEWALQENR